MRICTVQYLIKKTGPAFSLLLRALYPTTGTSILRYIQERIRIRIIKPAAYAPRIPLVFYSLSLFVFSATARRVDAVVQRRALTIDMDDCPCKSPEQTDRQTDRQAPAKGEFYFLFFAAFLPAVNGIDRIEGGTHDAHMSKISDSAVRYCH